MEANMFKQNEGDMDRGIRVVLGIVMIGTGIFLGGTWGLVLDAPRYLVLTDALIILTAFGIAGESRSRLIKTALLISLVFYLVFDVHRLVWARNGFDANWQGRDINRVLTALRNRTGPEKLVASPNPAMVDAKIDRPGVVLPFNLDDGLLRVYLVQYQPGAIIMSENGSLTFKSLTKTNWPRFSSGPFTAFFPD